MSRPTVQFQEPVRATLSLHQAVLLGDERAVQDALNAGADVNACDSMGRSVLCCALLGHDGDALSAPTVPASDDEVETRLRILYTILDRPDLSLYSLNHPLEFARGVTPLGLACWLNKVPDCAALLQTGVCAVDAMDMHGATPLMYAARDGYADVVAQLLSYAARPDLLDSNHRSAVQHAVKHPRIVWLCENHLRRQRDLKSTKSSPSRFIASPNSSEPDLSISSNSDFSSRSLLATTDCIIQMIQSNNIESLHTLLFPSPFPESIYVSPDQPFPSPASFSGPPVVLVNHRDADGYAPIHHAMMVPHASTECVDALYRAGADMALIAADSSTPLHILARYSRDSAFDHPAIPTTDAASKLLYSFTTHLIQDLKAPLAACDAELETCIHIAAEHGESEQVLAALLDCDSNGVVRAMCNDRGLRPVDVAKPEFLPVFYKSMERPPTSTSSHTIVPKPSTASISTISTRTSVASITTLGHHLFDIDPMLAPALPTSRYSVIQLTSDIFDNLERCSIALRGDPNSVPLADVSTMLKRTRDMSNVVLSFWKARVNESYEGFKGTNKDFMQTEKLLSRIDRIVGKVDARRRAAPPPVNGPPFARTIPRRGSVPFPSTPRLSHRKVASAPCTPASLSRAPSLSIHLSPQSPNLQEELEAVLKQRSDLFRNSQSRIFRNSQAPTVQNSHPDTVVAERSPISPRQSTSDSDSERCSWLEKFVLHNESTAWQVRQANLEEMDMDIEMLMTRVELLSTKINDVSLYGSINPRSIQTMRSLLSDRQETQTKLQKAQDDRYFLEWCLNGLAEVGREMADSSHLSAWLQKTVEQPEKARLQLDCLWDEEEGDEFGDPILESPLSQNYQERDIDSQRHEVAEEKPLPLPPSPSVIPSRQSLLLAAADPLFGRIRVDLRDLDSRITSADQLVALTRHSISQAQEFLEQAIKSREDKLQALWTARMNMTGATSPIASPDISPKQMPFRHYSPSSSTISSRSSLSLSAAASASSIASSPANSPPPTQSKFSFTSVISRIRTKSHTSFAQVQAAFSSQSASSQAQPQAQATSPTPPALAAAFEFEPVNDDLAALKRLLGEKISERVDGVNENVEVIDSWLRIVREVLRHYKRRVTAVC